MAIDASRLRVSPVFEGLTDEELERSAALFEEVELLAGSSLIKEGDFSYRFFVVLDGDGAPRRQRRNHVGLRRRRFLTTGPRLR